MTQRGLYCCLATVAALALAGSSAASGGPNSTDSVTGHGEVPGSQYLDVSAKSTQTGLDASGRARLTLSGFDPNLRFSGYVTCMRVVGATATTPAMAAIAVLVTDAPPGDPSQSMLINAVDHGKFSNVPDTLTVQTLTTPPPTDGNCPAPAPTFNRMTVADVVINNALP